MRAARIVYTIIAVFLLIPWLTYNVKVYFNLKNNRKRFDLKRILVLILVTVLMVTAVYCHYRFTISYQISLVAERAGELFSQRLDGRLDTPGYLNAMKKQGLSSAAFTTASADDLKAAGYQDKHYELFISERNYPADDGSTVIYLMHSDGMTSLYSLLKLRQYGYAWQVELHDVLSQEEFDKLNQETTIKFQKVK
ncbi:MAG TPA: hypothetical protein GX505_02300 [Clostridiales bacterium]|nr:hypothetical protein [Clostridiales bacterium]